jgi:hypothetical protein
MPFATIVGLFEHLCQFAPNVCAPSRNGRTDASNPNAEDFALRAEAITLRYGTVEFPNFRFRNDLTADAVTIGVNYHFGH